MATGQREPKQAGETSNALDELDVGIFANEAGKYVGT